jgi:hypothetical protein
VFKWGLSKADLLQLGWSPQHDELAARVMRERKLRLPRDRKLLLEIVLVHMAIKRGKGESVPTRSVGTAHLNDFSELGHK